MKIPIIARPLQYTLKVSGLWPDYFNILGVIIVMSALFTLIPFQLLDVWKEYDNIFIVMDDLSQISAEVLLYFKFLIIFWHRRVFKTLLKEMAEDYENKYKIKYWSELISASRRFTKLDYGMYALASASYHVQLIMFYIITPVEDREMMIRARYPFDYRSSPTYEILNIIQVIQGLIMCSIQALSESLLVALVLHACGHIDLLLNEIEEFSINCRTTRKNSSLLLIIKQHLKVLDIVNNIETVYTYVSFIQVFFSTFIICCSSYIVLAVTNNLVLMIKYSLLCMTAVWQGYSFCFSGQRLINKSEQISNKLYQSFWHDENPKEIRAISYMISRAQRSLALTAGKFTSLSAPTFTSMMKTSFSYISVIRLISLFGTRIYTKCDEMKVPIVGKPVEYTLKFCGLWPDYFNIFGILLVVSSLFTIMPFQIIDMLKEFDNTFILLDDLSNFFGEILLYSKYLVIWYHRRRLKSLLQEMTEDYDNEDKIEYWSEFISASHRFTKFDYLMYVGTSSMYYLQTILNYLKIPVEQREMMIRAQYPFDFRSSPMYEIMTLVQIVQGLTMCSLLALSESLLVALVLYACGHINLLSDKIDEFSLNCLNNEKDVSPEAIIKQHQKILNIVQQIETIYTYASFVQVFLSTFTICSTGYIVIAVADDIITMIKCGMLGATAMWQGYSFCFFGQRLINESEKISIKIYNTFWYLVNPKKIRALSYMINRSQTPLTLTAGKFTSLSAETYTTMMKTSFSYISVLRASNI
ncbi:uncharacterized protein LOC131672515 [Phymastichus coffea]|uniref:uncharacterized protein LOC131672515 n=1 Tax=Phymastichus coffea TaxID=108790 RepID=UPI00273B4C68|nr:uncharacterized protein LOC131672515 [Phymastichus coffea]